MIDLNYTIGADGQKILSATGSTIQSASITTSGFPVQITVTGDAEPAGAGWHELQIYRDSTAIGEIFHIETTSSGLNMTVAMSVIDTPVTGTYTYSVKIVRSNGMSARYSESGQLYMIVEEKVISSNNATNWLRRDINPPTTYYGYNSNMNASDSDTNWSIKKITVSGTVETVKWTNGSYGHNSIWNNRVESFQTPTGSLGVTCSTLAYSSNNVALNISWSVLAGVDKYQVIVSESGNVYSDGGYIINSNNNFNNGVSTIWLNNTSSYAYKQGLYGKTYSITINGVNVIGTTSSTITVTT
mgnify:CR=1 FL=1|jgi:hypothetical protein